MQFGINMHAEHGFCVMAGTVQCPIEGATGTIAANCDFAPEAVLQILLDGLAIKTAKWRVLHDVIKHKTGKCYAGGVV